MLDTEFRLTFPRALAELVRGAFEHLPGDGDGDVQIEIRFSAHGFTTLVDGVPEVSAASEERVVPQIRGLLRRIAVHRADPLLSLESGLVLAGRAGLLLPGPSGCGKTLLTVALLQAGARYGSDARIVLERGTMRVRPVALDLAIKEGGVAPLEGLFPGVADLRVHLREDGKPVRYLAPPADGWRPIESVTARWLVFPRYVPDRTPSFAAVSRPEALCTLLEDCRAEPGPITPDEIRDLAHWLAGVECHALHYRSLAEATLMLRRLVSSA